LRQDLERRGVFDLAVFRAATGRDRRLRRGAQLFPVDRLLERRTDDLRQRLAADLRTETLLEDLRRHLARPEALQPHALADLAHARANLVLQRVRGQADRELAPELADILNRNLHARS